MATQIGGLNYCELDFNADGTLNSDGGLPGAVRAGGIQDVFVLSHGWNAGADSARSLYRAMFTLLAGMIPGRLSTSIAVGVIWPSLLFPEDDPATARPVPSTGQQLAASLAPGLPAEPAAGRRDARPAAGPAAARRGQAAAVPLAGVRPGHLPLARSRGRRPAGKHHRRHGGRVRPRRRHVQDARG